MEDESRDDGTERAHAPGAAVRSREEDESRATERVEHPYGRLLENREDVRQAEEVSVSGKRREHYTDDEEHENREVKTVVEEELRHPEFVDVVLH